MNSLFEGNLFFLYLFACITIMNYSKMIESQKIILFYLMTYGLAILKLASTKELLIYLLMVSFFYLEFLSEDILKIKFIKKLRYRLFDYLFLMIFQYRIFLFMISILVLNPTIQITIKNYNNNLGTYFSTYSDYVSIVFFFITIFKVSGEKFKIKSVTDIINNEFEPPINNSSLLPYEDFIPILIEMEDRTFILRGESYNFLSIKFILIKVKQIWKNNTRGGVFYKVKAYYSASQIVRGYSTLEMQLLRTVALDSGYYLKIRRKLFELLYTNIILKSMKNFYVENNYVNNDYFKEYLLSIYIKKVRTKVDGTVYISMEKYLGDKIEEWTREKFFIACLGLPFREFTEDYVYVLHYDLIQKFNLNENLIRDELKRVSQLDNDYYGEAGYKY